MNIDAVHNSINDAPMLTELVRLLARQAAREWCELHVRTDGDGGPSSTRGEVG
jgi:hypothetical protein